MPLRPGEVERHYPVIEVARLLGMSREWVYERINDGTFVVANFGTGKSKRRIPASSLNAYIESHTYSTK
jgi:excisionase family DNA binding protein